MKFKSEDGRDWEEVTNITNTASDRKVIRPVKQEPKWEFDGPDANIGGVKFFTLSVDCSEDQAQLIKEAVEALMQYITSDGGAEYPYENKTGYEIAARAARQSMRENN